MGQRMQIDIALPIRRPGQPGLCHLNQQHKSTASQSLLMCYAEWHFVLFHSAMDSETQPPRTFQREGMETPEGYQKIKLMACPPCVNLSFTQWTHRRSLKA